MDTSVWPKDGRKFEDMTQHHGYTPRGLVTAYTAWQVNNMEKYGQIGIIGQTVVEWTKNATYQSGEDVVQTFTPLSDWYQGPLGQDYPLHISALLTAHQVGPLVFFQEDHYYLVDLNTHVVLSSGKIHLPDNVD